MTRKGALTRPWGAATRYVIAAGVAKLVDARDLKAALSSRRLDTTWHPSTTCAAGGC